VTAQQVPAKAERPVPRPLIKTFWAIHRAIVRASGGRVGFRSPEAGKTFEGEVARTSASIDTTTRTMQIEVALPNREGILLPGAFVQVALPLQASRSLVIPTNALLFRAEGLRVAVLDDTDHVHLRPIDLGRNYGQTVEVLAGVGPSDRLVLNPADSLAEGDHVVVPGTGKDAS